MKRLLSVLILASLVLGLGYVIDVQSRLTHEDLIHQEIDKRFRDFSERKGKWSKDAEFVCERLGVDIEQLPSNAGGAPAGKKVAFRGRADAEIEISEEDIKRMQSEIDAIEAE